MKTIRIEIPGVPVSVNHIYGQTKSGRRYLTNRGRTFKNAVGMIAKVAAREAGLKEIIKKPLTIHLGFNFPTMRGDIDNCIKAILDSMTGLIYKDDGLIYGLTATKRKDAEHPRTTIMIEINDAQS